MKKINEIIEFCEKEIFEISEKDLDIIGESFKDMRVRQLEYWESIKNDCVFEHEIDNKKYVIDKHDKIKIFVAGVDVFPICITELSLKDMTNLIRNYDNRHGLLDP